MTVTKIYEPNEDIENLKEGDIFSISDPNLPLSNNIYIKSTISMINKDNPEGDPEIIPIYVDLESGKFINIKSAKVHLFEYSEIIIR